MDEEMLVTVEDVNEAQQRANLLATEFREQQETMMVAEGDMVSELEITLMAFVEELRITMPGAVSFSAQRINELTGSGEVTRDMTLSVHVSGEVAAGFSDLVEKVMEV
ncbi:hypothetical protein B9D04_09625 [Weissella cibaria]|uniref:Uncharacterized protein n=1 Tax=Weissella cibaria TaxID=137591 RepID=A0A1X4JJ89_9LACO|nr:hypothetical protein [Weissella cibaria]OSP88840.1 hypothetical protein B9D04_09625 [Weissella cibaria]